MQQAIKHARRPYSKCRQRCSDRPYASCVWGTERPLDKAIRCGRSLQSSKRSIWTDFLWMLPWCTSGIGEQAKSLSDREVQTGSPPELEVKYSGRVYWPPFSTGVATTFPPTSFTNLRYLLYTFSLYKPMAPCASSLPKLLTTDDSVSQYCVGLNVATLNTGTGNETVPLLLHPAACSLQLANFRVNSLWICGDESSNQTVSIVFGTPQSPHIPRYRTLCPHGVTFTTAKRRTFATLPFPSIDLLHCAVRASATPMTIISLRVYHFRLAGIKYRAGANMAFWRIMDQIVSSTS